MCTVNEEKKESVNDQIKTGPISASANEKLGNGKIRKNPFQSDGFINKLTGSGENAKNGISTLVVISLFLTGIILTILICIEYWGKQCQEPTPMLDSIKGVWGIITPLLTLILGYVFGKGK